MNINTSRPELFRKTVDSIWTDPYIQNNLLTEHLDLTSDGASRNEQSIRAITDFVNNQIPRGSRLLDLGCGPGLYTTIFDQQGHTVTGIDLNRKSILYAREQSEKITYIEGDYIRDFPEGTYDAITLIYCDLGTHSDTDRDVLLQNCFKSLTPGGKLIFDVFNEKLIEDKQEGKSWEFSPDAGFWAPNEHLVLMQTFHYPENRTFAYQYNLIVGSSITHFIIWERYYTDDEIMDILKEIGFRNIQIRYDLLEKNDFTSNNQMFVVAEK